MDWIAALGSLFGLIGAALLVAAGRQYTRRQAFLRGSAMASGIVVALTENRESDVVSYFPKVSFRTPSGREVTFQSEMGSSEGAKQIGEPVAVRYRLHQPEDAELDGFMPLWGPTLVFGVLGVVFLFIGLGILTGTLPV
jgi:hypothetical protein